MKLQVAFDTTELTRAIAIAQDIAQFVDTIELGNLLLYRHGIEAVHKFRQTLPNHELLIDTKIIDRGAETVSLFAQAEVNWLTVMAGTSKEIIQRTCMEASKHNISIMLDLLDANSPAEAALDAKNLGIEALLFHHPPDTQETLEFFESWDIIRGNTELPIFISTHINRMNIKNITRLNPNGIVIGKGIVDAENPNQEAENLNNICKKVKVDLHIIE